MSSHELPGSLGIMFPTSSLPMKAERSRNKERLEASLTGLSELQLLRQRQECRVLSALCLGDSPVPSRLLWGAQRSARSALNAHQSDASDEHSVQTSSLQCTPWGIKVSLEQQVAELKVSTEVKSADSHQEDNQLSSGEVLEAKQNRFPESSFPSLVPRSLSSPEGTVEKEAAETRLSDPMRRTKVSDDFTKNVDQQARKVETYIIGLIQRRASPTRPSKPRTSLSHDGKAVTVVRQSSLCHKEEQYSSKLVSIQEISGPPQWSEGTTPQTCPNFDQERDLGTGFTEGAPLLYHNHLQQSVKHQPGLYHRPRQASMMNTSCSIVLDYPSFRVLQGQSESSNSEPGSPQHFHKYPSPPLLSKPYQQASPEDQLVSAEYIPAQPCRASTRAYAHHHSSPQKGSFMPKLNKSTYSPKKDHHHHQEQQPTASQTQPSRSRGGPKKCRSNDDKSSVSRKPGKKACRSQSENSLQRVPERRYDTAEREGGASGGGGKGRHNCQSRSKKQQHGGGSCRPWQSTQELSQDETDHPPVQSSAASNQKESCGRRTRKTRPTHAAYAYSHHHYQHHQHMDYQFERDQVSLCQPTEDYPHPGQGESESSMSEADSPDSSSLSSDSDESGSLVWPQQLSPQPSLPSPPVPPGVPLQSKAFVKIKASHALKKKILRFRTGSLKVMTTV